MGLNLKLLGEFALRDASGAELSLPTRKTRALLGYLAVNADRPQPRERLMALLWSDRAERQARQSLNQALLAIRKLADGDGTALIDSDVERVTLRGDAVTSDVGRLRALIADDPASAATMYEGPFLDGLSVPDPAFEEWLLATRSELHTLACNALDAAAASDDTTTALDCARRLVALDPLREDAHRRLMELLHRTGDRAGALRQFQACAKILQRELQVEPDATTKALFEEIRKDGGSRRPVDTEPERDKKTGPAPDPLERHGPAPPRAGRLDSSNGKASWFRWRLIAATTAIVFLFAGAGIVIWLAPWSKKPEQVTKAKSRLPLPNKPSIAVLPFANLGNDPQQEYFSDGMTDDLITDLSKVSGLFVIARNTVFAYKDKTAKIPQIAGELGVRYVLEGSVRRAGARVRINAQLVDATTGGHLWAERYDGTMENVFALQDRITQQITRALTLELTPSEMRNVADRGTKVVAAHDAFLKGWKHYLQSTPEDFAKAASRFKEAIALDPNYGRAHAALALTYWQASERFWEIHLGVNWMRARTLAMRHLDAARKSPTVVSHRLESSVYVLQRRYADSIAAARRATELAPNSAEAHRALAYALIMNGDIAEARETVAKAWRLDPRAAGQHFFLLGLIAFTESNYEQTVDLIERARTHLEHAQAFLPPLIAAYVQSGRIEKARMLSESYYEWFSEYSSDLRLIMYFWPFRDKTVAARLAEGLLETGIPGKQDGFYSLSDEQRLSGSEISDLVQNFGRQWKIHDVREFGQYPLDLRDSFESDGTLVRRYEYWSSGGVSRNTWIGRYRIEGDLLCLDFPQAPTAGGLGCRPFFRLAATRHSRHDTYVAVGALGFYEYYVAD